MSLCPFGTEAEKTIIPSVKSLGPQAELRLHYIGSETPSTNPADAPAFKSMHGPSEVDEDIRQLCIIKNFPDKYMDYLLERNLKVNDPDWKTPAKKVGLDPDKIQACVTSGEGAKLFSASIKESEAKKANASPTIEVAGKPYTGARGVRSFTLAMCGAIKASGADVPDACDKAQKMPPDASAGGAGCGDNGQQPPVEFNVKVVTETACPFCKPTLTDAIALKHTAAHISVVDSESPEGKDLVARYHVHTLPFYYLEKKVEQDPAFQNMNGFYVRTGDGYSIASGSDSFLPAIQLDRNRVPHHLDVFVESLAPYTPTFEGQLVQMLAQEASPDVTFSIHYVVQETVKGEEKSPASDKSPSTDVRSASLKKELESVAAGPLTSIRGDSELQEDMRQVCLFQHASMGTFFTYLSCRNKNLMDDSRADTCLQMTDAVQKCMQGPEAEKLLRQDAHMARDLNITGGPTLLWENRYGPFGWHDADWRVILGEKKEK
jgi:predicted DsbA family dithiol-disulfide isomerase